MLSVSIKACGYAACIIYAFVFFLWICKTPYMQSLTTLKTEKVSFSKVFATFLLFFKLGILSFGISLLIVGVIFFILNIIPMSIAILLYYTVFLSILFTLPLAYASFGKRVNQIILNRQNSLFFGGQSFARLLYFYTNTPLALKNIFVLWLSGLTLLRCFPPLFFLLIGLSVRFDNGLNIGLFIFLTYFTCYFVCLPKTQKYILNTFGKQSLRLLGWNSPWLYCMQCGGTAAGATLLAAGSREL